MKRVFTFTFLFLLWLSPSLWAGSVADTCDCPKLSCDSECETEMKVDFFTEKCPGGKVRSCSRPTCAKIDPFPLKCAEKMPAPASTKSVVGIIENLEGQAWQVQSEGQNVPLDIGSLVSEKDVIQVAASSRVEITFDDGNKITLSENSQVELSEVLITPEEHKRRTLLNLIRGKVRSQVKKQNSNRQPTQSSADSFRFKVRTPAAVAGVRGTDFVVIHSEGKSLDQATTQVATFEGLVELSDHKQEKKALVGGNETASLIASDLTSSNHKLKLTPTRQMQAEETQKLKAEMIFPKKVASAGTTVCEAPKADQNQCSYSCLNNPEGESTCRTDLESVTCVRRVCKPDGQWEDLSRLPSAYGDYCHPTKPVLGPCGY